MYGVWDAKEKKCAFLMNDNTCGKYDSITERERDDPYPMMGSGCSSPLFNSDRDAKLGQNNESVHSREG